MNREQRRKAIKRNVMTTERVREVVYGMFEVASGGSGNVNMQELMRYGHAEVNGVHWQIVWRRPPDNTDALVMLTSTPAAPGRWGAAIITINNGELVVETSVHKGCPSRL